MNVMTQFLRGCVAAWSFALALVAPSAQAQTSFPEKPILLVVPYEVGGATDVVGRFLATTLSARLGQAVVVDNMPGDGTALAAAWLAKERPDGYTLMLASGSTLVLNPAIRNDLGYHPINSFTPLGLLAEMHLVMLSAPDGPTSLPALLKQAREKPNSMTYGSYGIGSTSFFAGEMLKAMTDTPMVHVPSNGSSSNLRALMEGKVNVASDTISASTPLIKMGKIKALATFAPERLDTFADVPTMIELGYPELTLSAWFTLVGPKDLPAPVLAKLEAALKAAAATPEFSTQLQAMGIHPRWVGSAGVLQRIRHETPKMKSIALLDEIKG